MKKEYSFKEELLNSITHGIGVLFGIVAMTVLIVLASLYGSFEHIISYVIYGISFIVLYTASTLYHAIPHDSAKRILKICDHSAIYLLIAGTYTPFLILNLKGTLGFGLLGVVWGLAVLGIIFKLFYTGKFELLSTLLYIGMGWLIIFAIKPLSAALHPNGLLWLCIGGVTYTLGTIFYLTKRIPYNHALWHVFVLAGSVFHFVALIYSANFSF
ncbi:MAG: hemolysin III family protein [Bacteriovoracaceae bacterium]